MLKLTDAYKLFEHCKVYETKTENWICHAPGD